MALLLAVCETGCGKAGAGQQIDLAVCLLVYRIKVIYKADIRADIDGTFGTFFLICGKEI